MQIYLVVEEVMDLEMVLQDVVQLVVLDLVVED
jgi:hypothetical protein